TCPYAGEADVCIARKADNAPTPVTVASIDSDYLMHDNLRVLRQDRGHSYSLFDTSTLLQELNNNKPMDRQGTPYPNINNHIWKVMAVTNTNDYGAGVKGYGLRKLWSVLGGLWATLNQPDSADDLLSAFLEFLGRERQAGRPVVTGNFTPATDIFAGLYETWPAAAPQVQNVTTSVVRPMMNSFKAACDALDERKEYRQRGTRHFRTSDNEYKVRIVSPPNLAPAAPVAPRTTLGKRKASEPVTGEE
ncbi:hypothetical protein BGZ94_005880, partial [Podila epigama]